MNNYRLAIQYDGTRYKGWQRLGDGESTIQAKIENVLSLLADEEIEIIGASRTDAGVHAFVQIANFKTKKRFNDSEIKNYLNKYLPDDISILDVKSVSENFHSRFNCKEKTYLYKIWNKDFSNPFMRKYSMQVEKKLNIQNMIDASQYFIGTHDFTAFSNAKSKKKSMVREIYSIDIEEVDGFIHIKVRGNGFLYNMVRKIVGTLIEIGLGKATASDIPNIINSKDRSRAGYMAEAQGLFLEKVNF